MLKTQDKQPMRICFCRLAEHSALGSNMPQQAQFSMPSSSLLPAPVPRNTPESGQTAIGASAAPSQPQSADGSSHDFRRAAPQPYQQSNRVAEPHTIKGFEHLGQHSQADDAASIRQNSQIGEAAAGLASINEVSQWKLAAAGGVTPRLETRPYATELSLQVCSALCHLP